MRATVKQIAALEAGQRAPLSEKQFQSLVVRLAKLHGWKVYHTYDSRRSESGFPDLLLLRGSKALVIEAKSDTGKLTESQVTWLDAFSLAGIEAVCLRPANWNEIVKLLE